MKKILKNKSGITLIALVITIIVLLILAGVAVATLTGENGLLNKAKIAGEETKKAEALETMKMKVMEVQSEKNGNATLQDFVEYLQNDTSATYTISLTKTSSIQGTMPDISSANEVYITYNGFEFKVSKNLNIEYAGGSGTSTNDSSSDSSSDNGSSSGGPSTGGGTTSGGTESTLISNVTFEATETRTTSITLTITATAENQSDIAGYYVVCEGKVVEVSKSNVIKVSNLTKNTPYKFKCVALDVDGNIKSSSEQTLRTSNFSAEDAIPLEYAIITSDGIKNSRSENGELFFFKEIEVTGTRAMRN